MITLTLSLCRGFCTIRRGFPSFSRNENEESRGLIVVAASNLRFLRILKENSYDDCATIALGERNKGSLTKKKTS